MMEGLVSVNPDVHSTVMSGTELSVRFPGVDVVRSAVVIPGTCSGPNDDLCAGNAECQNCGCVTVGCPDCSLVGGGCLVCDESTFTCVPHKP